MVFNELVCLLTGVLSSFSKFDICDVAFLSLRKLSLMYWSWWDLIVSFALPDRSLDTTDPVSAKHVIVPCTDPLKTFSPLGLLDWVYNDLLKNWVTAILITCENWLQVELLKWGSVEKIIRHEQVERCNKKRKFKVLHSLALKKDRKLACMPCHVFFTPHWS